MTRRAPLRARLLIAALDLATWPLWWLLDRGVQAPTSPNPKALPLPYHDPKGTP